MLALNCLKQRQSFNMSVKLEMFVTHCNTMYYVDRVDYLLCSDSNIIKCRPYGTRRLGVKTEKMAVKVFYHFLNDNITLPVYNDFECNFLPYLILCSKCVPLSIVLKYAFVPKQMANITFVIFHLEMLRHKIMFTDSTLIC